MTLPSVDPVGVVGWQRDLGLQARRHLVDRCGGCGYAGTSDLTVLEEAALTLRLMGHWAHTITDVGVSGLHRLVPHIPTLQQANVVIVVAGMEGALASVVAGLTQAPVIAVPTSVGYGASFGGVAALLAMLNGCASGMAVVNIDNGFGAGHLAALINRKIGSKGPADREGVSADGRVGT